MRRLLIFFFKIVSVIYAKYFSYKYVHYKQLKLFCFILLRWYSYFLGTSW